jgi:allantoin racemase
MPRLLVINPNTTASMTEAIGVVARGVAAPGTEIVARNPARGPSAIEGPEDRAACLAPLLAEIARAEREGCDATAIACFDDPGVAEARALVRGPVIGIAEAAMRAGSTLASRWGIVTTVEAAVPGIYDLVARYGGRGACAGVRAAGVPVLALEHPDAWTRERVLGAARALVESGATAILLGCAGMSTLRDDLERELRVPAVDGVEAAVRILENQLASRSAT